MEKILSDWAKKNGLPSRNSTEKPTRKRRLASARTAKGKRLPKKRSKIAETYDTSYHEQATVPVDDLECEYETGESVKESNEKTQNLRDVTDLNYSKLMFNNEIQVTPKTNVLTEPRFKSSFVKRKFEFLEDRRKKDMSNEDIKKIKNNSNSDVILDTPQRESEVFPSLEDILSLRKKPIKILPKPTIENNTKLNISNSLENQKVNNKPFGLNNFSLEEIFKCKRKLYGKQNDTKKFQANESIPKVSPITVRYSKSNNIKNNAMKETEQLIVDSNGNHIKRVKLSSRNKVIYKTLPQTIATSTKETQTCNEAIIPEDMQKSSGKKDIAVGTAEFNQKKDSDKEMSEPNAEDRENKNSDKGGVNSEPIQNKTSITQNKDSQNENAVSTKSLEIAGNTDKQDPTKDEEGSVLLSIIEGKFTPELRPDIIPNTSQTLTKNEGPIPNKPVLTRYNSEVLLSSLFGDQIISSEDDNHNDSLDEDIFSKLNKSITDTQSQLRIKTIDQINNEISSQQKVCESLKVLFGVESEYLDTLSRNRKLGSCKPEKHNLLSSLFG